MKEIKHNLSKIFASQIAKLRKEKHLIQEELAEQIGMKRGVIAYYEASAKNPTIDTVKKFADFFNVSVADLIEEPEKTNKQGPKSTLQRQFEQLQKLPKSKQKIVSEMIEGVVK